MNVEQFLAFLNEAGATSSSAALSVSLWLSLGLAFLGGLAMNLTPCVLPMIPVNIAIIGRKFSRGLFYGLGQALVCGVLGLLAALGGGAIGMFQGSRVFNGLIAAFLVFLALCLADIFHLDFSRASSGWGRRLQSWGAGGVFLLGGVSALLASACVAPALATVLITTAAGVAEGHWTFAMLPFAFGLGMGAPWPFVASGIGHVPRPGVWMVHFKRVLALAVFALACVYGFRAVQPSAAPAFAASQEAPRSSRPILYKVSAPWCVYCHKMDATTLKDPAVLKALERFDVRTVEVNDLSELAFHPVLRSVKIIGVPTYVVSNQ